MFDILSYTFFQNALIWWALIALISAILWVFIVMRKEANITHSIANFLFLWVAISLLFNWNYYLYAFIFWIISSIIIFYIEKTDFVTKESTKEIISQAWIWWWILVISYLDNLTIDINNFLFWSMLFINKWDILIISVLLIIMYILFYKFKDNFISLILNQDIAKTNWINIDRYNLFFLIFLSIFIWISIKIFWILLIWAFLIIPANIWKLLSSSLKNTFLYSSIISLTSVILWLFLSYYLETTSSATIVLILVFIFLISIIIRKKSKSN